MKKRGYILLVITSFAFAAFTKASNGDMPVAIPAGEQKMGDAAKGYEYLTTGDFLKSGLPYDVFIMARGERNNNLLHRTGKNATVEYGYNVVSNKDSIDIVIPTCLHCHAELFAGKLVMGLGNASTDFSNINAQNKNLSMLKMLRLTAPKKYKAVEAFIRSVNTIDPYIETEARGVNPADKLAAVLVAHRNPQTLKWSSKALIEIPQEVIPTDVPAWWLLKKKNAMFYTGFGRGDFSKFLMMSNLLTVSDSAEAREVSSHFSDVLAYIYSIKPPLYEGHINEAQAQEGKVVFNNNCSRCHGTYGEGGYYPNLLIPGSIIGTDSMLYLANQQNPQFIEWFNKSWFAMEPNPAKLAPFNGYIAPPLDGVWITAPYFHNGSVPTIEAVLNSKLRPAFWTRSFSNTDYDYSHLGWKYKSFPAADGKKSYNTTLPGYGNYGHYFGDALNNKERDAVIEYLKTL